MQPSNRAIQCASSLSTRLLHVAHKRWYSKNYQGMNFSVFRSVFEPINAEHPAAGSIRDGRYLWRWDWHLRHFIYAMMPPAAAYLYVLGIKWYMGDEVEKYRHLVEQRESEDASNKVITLGDRISAMEMALERMEKLRIQAEREVVLDKVRAILRKYIDC